MYTAARRIGNCTGYTTEMSCPDPNRRIPTATKSLGCSCHAEAECLTRAALSDLCLQCCNSERLHHGLSWLRLHFHLLAEHHPRSSFGGWLHTSLDPAKAWDREDAVLLHLCCGEGRQATKESRHRLCLELVLFRKLLNEASFRHGFTSFCGGLHRLHSFHWGHG